MSNRQRAGREHGKHLIKENTTKQDQNLSVSSILGGKLLYTRPQKKIYLQDSTLRPVWRLNAPHATGSPIWSEGGEGVSLEEGPKSGEPAVRGSPLLYCTP